MEYSPSNPIPPGQLRRCIVQSFGIIPYKVVWDKQRSLVKQRLKDPSLDDILLLLEHPPVYTLGTGASLEYLKFDSNIITEEIYRIERGGEVTYHCPGQLVGYPILNLRYYSQDLHWYLRQLEEVIIQVIKGYGLSGERITGLTGVWVNGYKIAAIGIKVSRWITMHGFSLNVCPDLTGFNQIIPCGIEDKPVGSLAQFIPNIDLEIVRKDIIKLFSQVFQVELIISNVKVNG
ncbi:lipoyl(octanoyl) transferase LipB [Aphanothece sacrum]|uniref:Octanoyltransferase n=1 Tax=Aphanothece sacrum FPU1 TaxID=1920663 RepID=A0A401ID50_APHSA|nr:lipoyl(octanoyl) transferase LipB [Aphanothece sacrum]GBF79164.1 octanoyltransferase [Aphanothece sacrum FPU1]GBF86553.1 octanoyltransferase [Aphanothece sacrum FPU3]